MNTSPPKFGQVFISLKQSGSYNITATQKQRLILDVIKPISVVTVTPTIIDPDYTFLKVTANIVYDQKKTTLTSNEIEQLVKTAIRNFSTNSLNTFNSLFNISDLISYIQGLEPQSLAIKLTLKFRRNSIQY
jgi:hypothetical protein